ncbi:MAG: hypothetical protein LBR23_08665 [Spirochaetaceae bacterium]|jgi:hypothetical protein|nr:hypothetical protein [Spirochaetaceae bacterium]
MKKLSLLLGVAALVLAATVMMGCENATEEKTVTVNGGFDGTVIKSEQDLADAISALDTDEKATYAFIDKTLGTTAKVVSIPAGVTVNVYNDVVIGTGSLVVAGTLNVKKGASLTATASTNVLKIGEAVEHGAGTVNVENGGTLAVGSFADIKFAADYDGAAAALASDAQIIAALSTGKVTGGSTASAAATLNFASGAIYDPTTAVVDPDDGETDGETLLALLSGKFTITAISTPATDVVGNITVPKGFSVAASDDLAPTGDVTVKGTLTLANDKKLTILAGKKLDIAADSTVGFSYSAGGGGLVLTGAADTGGAKLTGAGKVTAGSAEIVGGSSGWQAVGTGTVTIAPTSAVITTITASANTAVLTAQGAGAVITEKTGSGNSLTIAASTVVDLKGTASAAAGSIVLTAGASNQGKLTLGDTTSKILIGAGTGGSNAAGVSSITIGSATVTNTSLAAADYQVADGKLVQIGGTTAGNIAAGASDNVVIKSDAAFSASA